MEQEESDIARLRDVLTQPEPHINLAAAALMLAEMEHRHIAARMHMQELAALAATLRPRLAPDLLVEESLPLLGLYLGEECGFRGNEEDYYDPANSYLNEVLRRRVGLPITLSLVYIEVGRRVGLDIQGIGFPGHFIVGAQAEHGQLYLDPFHRGRLRTRSDLAEQLRLSYGRTMPLREAMLQPVTKRSIIVRMLRNLKQAYISRKQLELAIRAESRLISLDPGDLGELRDRAVMYFQLQQWDKAKEDLDTYLSASPTPADAQAMREMKMTVETLLGTLN